MNKTDYIQSEDSFKKRKANLGKLVFLFLKIAPPLLFFLSINQAIACNNDETTIIKNIVFDKDGSGNYQEIQKIIRKKNSPFKIIDYRKKPRVSPIQLRNKKRNSLYLLGHYLISHSTLNIELTKKLLKSSVLNPVKILEYSEKMRIIKGGYTFNNSDFYVMNKLINIAFFLVQIYTNSSKNLRIQIMTFQKKAMLECLRYFCGSTVEKYFEKLPLQIHPNTFF
jgi:hypothetical protein